MKNRAVFGRDYLAAEGGAAAAAPVTVILRARSVIKLIARQSRGVAGNILLCITAERVRGTLPHSITTTGAFAGCKTGSLIISSSGMGLPPAMGKLKWATGGGGKSMAAMFTAIT